MLQGLEFQNGQLVKVHGMRPDYMDGYALLALVRVLGAEVHRLRREARIAGVSVEAMAEMKAVVDGHSQQTARDVVYGALAEIRKLPD